MSEEDFNLAANYIQSHHHDFSKDNLLKFYGFYKRGTAGVLDEKNNPKPSFFRMTERSKWDAWNALKNVSEGEAREKYVNLLTELKSNWREEVEPTKSKQAFGVAVSCFRPNEETLDEADKTIEDFIKEGNVEKFKELLSSIESKEELNSLDNSNGMGLIHWAADRGNLEILKLILSQKDIDINLVDCEHQTALHYASSCGHKSCVVQLLKYNADKEIKDADGNLPIDVAFDDEIKKLLC
jgi:acyl-CoA-binding protein